MPAPCSIYGVLKQPCVVILCLMLNEQGMDLWFCLIITFICSLSFFPVISEMILSTVEHHKSVLTMQKKQNTGAYPKILK